MYRFIKVKIMEILKSQSHVKARNLPEDKQQSQHESLLLSQQRKQYRKSKNRLFTLQNINSPQTAALQLSAARQHRQNTFRFLCANLLSRSGKKRSFLHVRVYSSAQVLTDCLFSQAIT